MLGCGAARPLGTCLVAHAALREHSITCHCYSPLLLLFTELVSIPQQPQQWQSLSLGLVDLLLESCPAVAFPTLQGTLDPAGIPQEAAPMLVEDTADGRPVSTPGSPTAEPAAEPAAGATAQAPTYPADAVADAAGVAEQCADADAGAADVAEGLPSPKRQRAGGPAGVLAGAAGDDEAVAPAHGNGPGAAAAAAAGGVPEQQPARQPASLVADVDTDCDDDELLAGLGSPSAGGLHDEAALAAASPTARKRQRSSSDDDDDGLGHLLDSDDADADGMAESEQQALEEGDYPEADEDAIRAEAVSAGKADPVLSLETMLLVLC